MEKFTQVKRIVVPIDRPNVDTDAIIPKQFLKSIKRTGFGPNLFDEWRYLDAGEPGMDHSERKKNNNFILNKKPYDNASILLTGKNFGCGSSREHAPWAISDFGFKAIISESFADIFYNNCFKNGILPIVLQGQHIDILFDLSNKNPKKKLGIDLENQILFTADSLSIHFELDVYRKESLLKGLDEIGQTLEKIELIKTFEDSYKNEFPWLFREN